MQPLGLDAPDWTLLSDASGSAQKIPALLAALERAEADALDELFGRICHQSSVYSASIAAFPHLITAASRLDANPEFQSQILCLARAICESADFANELHASSHAQALKAALPMAIELADAALQKTLEVEDAIYLLKSLASFQGMQTLARVLEGFVSEEFTLECPSCAAELYIWPCDQGFFIADEDPVSNKQARRTFVSRGVPLQSRRVDELRWLEKHCAIVGLVEFQSKLPFLCGAASCPSCGNSFRLYDELAEQVA